MKTLEEIVRTCRVPSEFGRRCKTLKEAKEHCDFMISLFEKNNIRFDAPEFYQVAGSCGFKIKAVGRE